MDEDEDEAEENSPAVVKQYDPNNETIEKMKRDRVRHGDFEKRKKEAED